MRALIIDDEPLARERLRDLLDECSDVSIVGECEDGREAVRSISEATPDVIFLDIHMPGLNGFEVLESVGDAERPFVIFTTAFDEHAVRAFESHAVDYLLKPIEIDRLKYAVDRVAALARGADRDTVSKKLLDLLRSATPRYADRFAVRRDGRMIVVPVADIDWIEAAGNYVRLHAGNQAHLLRSTLQSVEHDLDPHDFVRIHRRLIVNVDRVTEVAPGFRGHFFVTLAGGRRLEMQRSYADRLRAAIRHL